MLVFLAGHRADGPADGEGAARLLRDTIAATPFAGQLRVHSWRNPSGRMALAWAVHDRALLGGVEQVACQERRMALVAGRPVRWRGPEDADGREPPHGAAHLGGILDGLDGRFAVVRAQDDALEIRTDVLGAYPVYATTAADQTWWASGLAGVLEPLTTDGAIDERSLASLLVCGWPLDGQPRVRGVRRLPRGVTVCVAPDGRRSIVAAPERQDALALLGGTSSADAAARDLVASVRALADWPGRPSMVPVTGGRDSRVILAAALASGISFEALTAGGDEQADVRIGRELCAVAGIAHRQFVPPGGRWLGTDPKLAVKLTRLRGGTLSLADGAGFAVVPASGPLALWHSGQGGEIARGHYGRGRGPAVLVRAALGAQLSGWRPWRQLPLTRAARARVRATLREWADEWQAQGAAPADLPQLAYLDLRMGFWAGPSHGAVEWTRDTTSPLWSWKLLAPMLAGSVAERHAETLHRRLVALLAPQLTGVPFEDGATWAQGGAATQPPAPEGAPSQSSSSASSSPPPAAAGAAPGNTDLHAAPTRTFAEVQGLARAGLATADGVASVVDRRRAQRLLTAPEAELDWRRRSWVWNLFTAAGPGPPPGQR